MANYTYLGTDTVKNKLGATRQDELKRVESRLVAARIYELTLGHGPKGRFDAAHLKAIHRHLFQDVYEWAGRTRNERVRLSDGTIATEPVIRKASGAAFLAGGLIADALDDVAARLRAAGYHVGLPRAEFAVRAADLMAELNAIHPFREGNGRAQRAFVTALARRAGYGLDFTVVSKERMIQASIAANEHRDPTLMRRLFDEISDPARTAALRKAIAFFEAQQFPWNDHYLATTERGHPVELTMAGIAGDHFMGRTSSHILIGHTSDLPDPIPHSGETFTIDPSGESAGGGDAKSRS